MTTKADCTEEEWAQLMQAPVDVGMLVIMADLHVTSMVGEMKGMFKGMMEKPTPEGAQELVGSLLEDIQAMAEKKEKMEMPDTKGKDPAAVTAEFMQSLTDVASLVDEKCAEDEAVGYKQWLMGVAETTAEAGKEGGFLGIGAVRVSDKERAMMNEISLALGLT
jgi:hypothetical protein